MRIVKGFIVMALLHGGLKHIGLCNPLNDYKTPENVLIIDPCLRDFNCNEPFS